MKNLRWKTLVIVVTAMMAWAALVIAMPLFGIGGLNVRGTSSRAFADAACAAAREHRGNLALVLIDHGKVAQSCATSIGKPVSGETIFQMASVSKWVTAWGVMALVEQGQIQLDAPVSRYLKRWKLASSDYPTDQVTVRRLLSHTSGLTDDLGYCGFAPGAPIQTLPASLGRAADACPLRSGVVQVGDEAGTWRYSGGGYTLLQLLIEDVTGEPFANYMQKAVLRPLGMTRSTYRTGAAGYGDVAQFFDSAGRTAPHNRYTAAAAASLYSTADDMARFALAHLAGPGGEVPGRGVLSPASVATMRKAQARLFGTDHWGLGVQLYATSTRGGVIFGHDGFNVPAVNTSVRIEDATSDAIVALSTGGSNIAATLGSAWTLQRRKNVTPAMVYGAAMRFINPATALSALIWLVGGWVAILIAALLVSRRGRSRDPAQRANM